MTELRRKDERKGLTGEWIEAVAKAIEREKMETGRPFVVTVGVPLGRAQSRLLAALGVQVRVEAES